MTIIIHFVQAVSFTVLLAGILTTQHSIANDAGRQLTEFPYKPDAPTLQLRNTSGNIIDIKHLEQSVIVINFWASWCPSCVKELRTMHKTAALLTNMDVAVLAVNIGDNINLVNHYFEDYKPAYEILLDEKSKSTAEWQIMGLPTTYVVGPDRKIHYGAIGVLAWESDEVQQTILKLGNSTQ